MSFSFYGSIDAAWIDTTIMEFNISSSDVVDEVKYSGFEAKAILDSPNPVIYCLINLIIEQLLENDLIQELSQDLQTKIREQLQETIFTNCYDSHLQANDVFSNLKDQILDELEEQNSGEAHCEIQKLEKLFADYDF